MTFQIVGRMNDWRPWLRRICRNKSVLLLLDTRNWHNSSLLDNLSKPVRPIVETGQTGSEDMVKSQIGLHYSVDLAETIEMHI